MNQIIDSHDTRDVIGIVPQLPWPLSRSKWWTQPVHVERLAVLRIVVALVTLIDLLTTYLPNFSMLFGPQSLGAPGLMEWVFDAGQWSVLQGVDEPWLLQLAFAAWMVTTVSLLLGWNARLSACLVWVLSVSFTNCNIHAINAGDSIRNLLLFYLMISPCGAAWSLDAKARRHATGDDGARLMHPWALRLLCVQLAFIYCASGICKLTGQSWVQGESLHYVLGNICLTRTAFWTLPIPAAANQLMTWIVLAWEVTFPVLLLVPRTRKAALLLGVLFHIGIFVTMEIGFFPFYMLAFYIPWLKLGPDSGAHISERCRRWIPFAPADGT